MNIYFYLRKGNKEYATVMCRVRVSTHVFEFSIKESIRYEFWDVGKQRMKGKSDRAKVVNHKIQSILERAERVRANAYFQNLDLFEALKNEFKPAPETSNRLGVLAYIETLITRKRNELTANSIKNYDALLTKLKQYATDRNASITWQSLNNAFFDAFKSYLIETGLNNNSIKKHIDVLKAVLRNAKREGYTINTDFESYSTAKLKTKTDEIALTIGELKAIKSFKTNEVHLARVKDAFLLMCLTGLRVSDIRSVTRESISGGVLTVRTRKNKGLVSIPLTKDAVEILERNNYSLELYSDRALNLYIKQLCQAVGGSFLNDETVSTVKGTEIITETVKRYNRVSNHTARRTFVTIAYELGIDLDTVSKLVGHSNTMLTALYNKVKTDEVIKKARNRLNELIL
jgi:site-specific recombinase XerD